MKSNYGLSTGAATSPGGAVHPTQYRHFSRDRGPGTRAQYRAHASQQHRARSFFTRSVCLWAIAVTAVLLFLLSTGLLYSLTWADDGLAQSPGGRRGGKQRRPAVAEIEEVTTPTTPTTPTAAEQLPGRRQLWPGKRDDERLFHHETAEEHPRPGGPGGATEREADGSAGGGRCGHDEGTASAGSPSCPIRVPPSEIDDVFLRRPNFRKRNRDRVAAELRKRGGHAPPRAADAAAADHNGTEHTSHDDDDDDEVRVMVGIVSTRKSELLCSALASAYLSGLPAVVMGFGQRYTNFLDKARTAVRVFRGAGLRPRDVVMVLDEDILFSSGVQLTAALDRFIALSPESPAELDARAVRDGRGTMLAPVLFGAEEGCVQLYVIRSEERPLCKTFFDVLAHTPFDNFAAAEFPDSFWPHNAFKDRFINGGIILGRMWAFEEYYAAFEKFQQYHLPINHHGKWTGVYADDQGISSGLLSDLLFWEATTLGVLNRTAAAAAAVLATTRNHSDGVPGQVQRQARGPYALRAGLLDADYLSAFALVAVRYDPHSFGLSNVLWQPRNADAIRASMDHLVRRFSALHPRNRSTAAGDDVAAPVPDIADGSLSDDFLLRHHYKLPQYQREFAQFIAQQDARLAEMGQFMWVLPGTFPTSLPPFVRRSLQGGTGSASGMQRVTFQHPLPRSRHPNVTSIEMAYPLAVGRPFLGKQGPATGAEARFAGATEEWGVFPSILHFAGVQKAAQVRSMSSVMPWKLPLRFGGPEAQRRTQELREYVAGMPVELWAVEDDGLRVHRRVSHMSEFCVLARSYVL